MRSFFEAFEAEKLAELPGGFPLKQPYTMPARVRRTVGAPVNQGTIPAMKATGTAGGKKPKGMGMVTTKQATLPMGKAIPPMKSLMGGFKVKPRMTIAKPPKGGMVRLGSYPTLEQAEEAIDPAGSVGRRLVSKEASEDRIRKVGQLLKKLESTDDLTVKVAALMHLAELRKEARFATLLRAGLGAARHGAGSLARSKLFWGGAGLAGAAYGVSRLAKGMTGSVERSQKKREKKLPSAIENPWAK
jgi:hypothetical protein